MTDSITTAKQYAIDTASPGHRRALKWHRADKSSVTWFVSAVLGFALVFNQGGQGLEKILREFTDLNWLSAFWSINVPVATAGGRWFLGICIIAMTVAYVGLWRKHPAPHIRTAFYLGIFSGYVILPALLLSIVAAGLVVAIAAFIIYWLGVGILWLLSIIYLYIIEPVAAFIAIPFIWIWNNGLHVALEYIASPFIWFWNNFLEPVLSFIAIPFAWIWSNALLPFLKFLFFVIMKWVFIAVAMIALAIVLILLTFSMFGAVWKVFEESFRNAANGEFTEKTAFACGAGTGLFIFDLSLAYGLHVATGIIFFPAISHFVLLLVPSVFLLRLAFSRAYEFAQQNTTSYRESCRQYYKESRMEIFVSAALIPILLVIAILSTDEN